MKHVVYNNHNQGVDRARTLPVMCTPPRQKSKLKEQQTTVNLKLDITKEEDRNIPPSVVLQAQEESILVSLRCLERKVCTN